MDGRVVLKGAVVLAALASACGGVTSSTGRSSSAAGGASGSVSGEGGAEVRGGGGAAEPPPERGGARGGVGSGGVSAVGAAGGTGGNPPMNAAGGRGARDSGIDTGAGGSAPIDAGPVCTFRFEVTTVTAGGLYAPHNAAAIWIETASAEFVKTLRVWSFLRNTVLIRWVASSGRSRVDAVTGATRVTHGPIDAAWNCTDTSEQEVADGAYRVCVTFAEANYVPGVSPDAGAGQPPYACFPFDKGRAAVDTTFPPEPNFTGARVSLSESR